MEVISRFIEQNFGLSFLVGVIITGVLISGTIWLAIFLYKVISKNQLLEKSINSLPCSDHSERLSSHTDKISNIEAFLSKIDGKLEILLKVISTSLQPKETILSNESPSLSKKNSPRVLNNNGIIVSKEFECESFFKNNKDWLIEELSKFSPKTPLDVETYGTIALRIASSDSRFNDIKNKIYNSAALELSAENGTTKKYEITLEDILFILSLYLRDEYLRIHPEIIS